MTKQNWTQTKTLPITKGMVWQAWKKVKANKGSSGVDGKSITDFESNIEKELYKVWNRLSSGSYFPPSVKQVLIPQWRRYASDLNNSSDILSEFLSL